MEAILKVLKDPDLIEQPRPVMNGEFAYAVLDAVREWQFAEAAAKYHRQAIDVHTKPKPTPSAGRANDSESDENWGERIRRQYHRK